MKPDNTISNICFFTIFRFHEGKVKVAIEKKMCPIRCEKSRNLRSLQLPNYFLSENSYIDRNVYHLCLNIDRFVILMRLKINNLVMENLKNIFAKTLIFLISRILDVFS